MAGINGRSRCSAVNANPPTHKDRTPLSSSFPAKGRQAGRQAKTTCFSVRSVIPSPQRYILYFIGSVFVCKTETNQSCLFSLFGFQSHCPIILLGQRTYSFRLVVALQSVELALKNNMSYIPEDREIQCHAMPCLPFPSLALEYTHEEKESRMKFPQKCDGMALFLV